MCIRDRPNSVEGYNLVKDYDICLGQHTNVCVGRPLSLIHIFGVFVYWALNGIIFLVDKKHRNLIDFLLRTYLIRVEAETIESKQEVKAPVTEKKVESVSKVSYPRNHIDLRVRSNFSANGEYNVEEIFQMAAKEGIHTISITDWNSVKANALAVNTVSCTHLDVYKRQYIILT